MTPFAPTDSVQLGKMACPVCSNAMIKRIAKRGANAGKAFWGCTSYPACRGTRPMGESDLQNSSVNLHG